MREEGYYWIRWDDGDDDCDSDAPPDPPDLAYWDGASWLFAGNPEFFPGNDSVQVVSERLVPPGEKK